MRIARLLLTIAACAVLFPAAWASNRPPEDTKTEKSSSASGPVQPVREAIQGLERAIAEEPPKAIRNLKDAVNKRLNRNQTEPAKDK